ncbi:hypothetical protein [Siminovitchia fordii]|uniref:hypothetical protein n=1 Tax=Siminovitchia fordii TaxID=254759 RepID=UPI00146B7626|nr:hypothetical protein [Siminovitchia fordii]
MFRRTGSISADDLVETKGSTLRRRATIDLRISFLVLLGQGLFQRTFIAKLHIVYSKQVAISGCSFHMKVK